MPSSEYIVADELRRAATGKMLCAVYDDVGTTQTENSLHIGLVFYRDDEGLDLETGISVVQLLSDIEQALLIEIAENKLEQTICREQSG